MIIQRLYNNLFEGKDDNGKLSAKTIKNIHGVLHKALAQAQRNGYIKNNPSEDCVLPTVQRQEINPLSEEEIKDFMVAIRKDRFADIYITTLFTGMRQGEVLGLTWDCVDFDKGVIYIKQQLQKEKCKNAKYYLASLKNNKPRIIVPSSYVLNTLKDHKKEQDDEKRLMGNRWTGDELSDNFIFTDEYGHHLSHCTVYKHYKKIVQKIGVPKARFHDLRHSYAVIALQNGDDIKTIQATLGHHTAAFTLDIYGHVSQRMYLESAKRMDSFISGLNEADNA